MKKKTIIVTQENIDKNSRNVFDTARCPLAKAVRAQFKKHVAVQAYSDAVEIDHKIYELPKKAVIWQERLLDGKKVKPISFTLNV